MALSLVSAPATEPSNVSGVYVIVCNPTGRLYVGSAVWIAKRWRGHRESLRLGKHLNPMLQRAWDKYGEDAFSFHTLCVEEREALIAQEQLFMDALLACDSRYGFNINPRAGSNRGRVFGPEVRRKISIAMTGRKFSAERRAQISAQLIGNQHRRGIPHTPETLAFLRIWRVGKTPALGLKHTDETKERIGAHFRGKPLSKEHRQKISAALKGRPKHVA